VLTELHFGEGPAIDQQGSYWASLLFLIEQHFADVFLGHVSQGYCGFTDSPTVNNLIVEDRKELCWSDEPHSCGDLSKSVDARFLFVQCCEHVFGPKDAYVNEVLSEQHGLETTCGSGANGVKAGPPTPGLNPRKYRENASEVVGVLQSPRVWVGAMAVA